MFSQISTENLLYSTIEELILPFIKYWKVLFVISIVLLIGYMCIYLVKVFIMKRLMSILSTTGHENQVYEIENQSSQQQADHIVCIDY